MEYLTRLLHIIFLYIPSDNKYLFIFNNLKLIYDSINYINYNYIEICSIFIIGKFMFFRLRLRR